MRPGSKLNPQAPSLTVAYKQDFSAANQLSQHLSDHSWYDGNGMNPVHLEDPVILRSLILVCSLSTSGIH